MTEDAGKVHCGTTLTDGVETHMRLTVSSVHSMSKRPNYAIKVSETRYATSASLKTDLPHRYSRLHSFLCMRGRHGYCRSRSIRWRAGLAGWFGSLWSSAYSKQVFRGHDVDQGTYKSISFRIVTHLPSELSDFERHVFKIIKTSDSSIKSSHRV